MVSDRSSSEDDAPAEATVLPVGRVSALLGIPAVTLRTWELRYGVGPSARTAGLHRRYTGADIERLRRMQRLIARGTSAHDAARLSAPRRGATGGPDDIETLLADAEALRVRELGDLLDDCLEQRGAERTWTDVVVPAYRRLEQRFGRYGDCTDIELVLARAVEAAVERSLDRRQLRPEGPDPILLVHCPQERHTLPITALRAVLAERGQPAVQLGPEASETAILGFIGRTHPSCVLLWASMKRAGQAQLRTAVRRTGYPTLAAGPGWPSSAQPLTSLPEATTALIRSRNRR